MFNNFNQNRLLSENTGRYFGKELYNIGHESNENKPLNQLTSFNMPLSQRQEIGDPFSGVFMSKRMPLSQNGSFCQVGKAGKKEKENSGRKQSKLQTEVSAMETEEAQYGNFNVEEVVDDIREAYQFDLNVAGDTLYVAPYIQEIFDYLRDQEGKYVPERQYMTIQHQPDINSKMRAILVDWLVDVHLKFKLRDETLYETITLIDRYLAITTTSRQQLQLVGVSSLFIACKYEEIYPPDLKDFVYITDNAYSKQEVLEMEGKILLALEFNITQPSMNCFLSRYGRVAGLDKKNLILAQYLLELALIEIKFVTYRPSLMVSAVVYLVHKIRKVNDPWNNTMQHLSQLKEVELRPCAKELCLLLQSAEKHSLQAVRKKFSTPKYLEVSRIRVERTNK